MKRFQHLHLSSSARRETRRTADMSSSSSCDDSATHYSSFSSMDSLSNSKPSNCIVKSRSPLLVRSTTLLGGSFHDGDGVRVFDEAADAPKKNQRAAAAEDPQQTSLGTSLHRHRCLSLPFLSEISACDDEDEDDDHDDEAESGSDDSDRADPECARHTNETGPLQPYHRPHHDAADSKTHFTSTGDGPSEAALRGMIEALSADEVEIAACSSYAFAKTRQTPDQDPQKLDEERQRAAQQMAARHWVAEKGDTVAALHKMRSTLQLRPRIDAIRECFERDEEDEVAQTTRHRVRHYLGPQGRMFVRGYDREDRAIFHFVVSNSPKNQDLALGCVDSHYYILEKAFACTERRSKGRQSTVIVSVDFANFQKWQAPPLSCVREMLDMLQHHYPERLHRVYLVNAPRLFLCLWNIIKPFVDPHTKTKFQFVDSLEHVLDADQAMPYQRPDGQLTRPVDMDEFYQLPYDLAYDEMPE